jgi:hypothetical protein
MRLEEAIADTENLLANVGAQCGLLVASQR